MRLGLAKAFGAAGVLITAALVGGTLIGSARAVDEGDRRVAADAGVYCDAFLDTLAAELDTTREGLAEAVQAAATAAIDAAVAAGDLSEERATALRERVAQYDGEGCRWFGPRGHGPRGPAGFIRGFVGTDTLEAAADALGIDESALRAELRESGALRAVAEAHGVSYADVSAAVLAAVKGDLDAAVAEGKVEQDRADAILDRVTTWLDAGGELRAPRHRDDERGDDAGETDDGT